MYLFQNCKFQEKRIVHLDLKDENILLKNIEGNPFDIQVKLVDFGLAQQIPFNTDCLEVRTTTGTLPYRSPEQIMTGIVSPASDMWNMGCIISEMVTLNYFQQSLCDDAEAYERQISKREEYDIRHVSKKY